MPDFVRYARLCFERYGDRVKHWLTFNEPWVITSLGYAAGAFAPGHKSDTEPWIVGHSLLVAHAHAAKVYHDEFKHQNGQVGITLNGDWAEPWDQSPESEQASSQSSHRERSLTPDIKAAQTKLDFSIGWFADPVYLGKYPDSMKELLKERLPEFTEEEVALLKGSSDVSDLQNPPDTSSTAAT